jgi:hypothetical protein
MTIINFRNNIIVINFIKMNLSFFDIYKNLISNMDLFFINEKDIIVIMTINDITIIITTINIIFINIIIVIIISIIIKVISNIIFIIAIIITITILIIFIIVDKFLYRFHYFIKILY